MAYKSDELKAADVRRIRAMREEIPGITAQKVGMLYGRNAETIRKIWRRETYAWVSEVVSQDEMEAAAMQARLLAVQAEVNAGRVPSVAGDIVEKAREMLGLD